MLAYGSYRFVGMTKTFLPFEGWTLWRFLVIWPVTLVWWLSLMVGGRAILTRVLRLSLPAYEQLVMSFAIGWMAFHTLISLFGFVGLLNRFAYYAIPLLMLAPGARAFLADVKRRLRHRTPRRRRSPLRVALTCFGVVGFALIYFPIIARSHIGFDSAWYHVPIAEHYVAAHGIVRFPEGWFLGAYPQLTSITFAWGLLTPGLSFADKLVLLNHLELVVFIMTLVGIAALAIRVARSGKLSPAWVACFAFPTLYLHDLQLAADHVAAFWFAPVYLALFRSWRALDLKHVALVALGAAGALDTKYTAFPIVVLPAVALVARALWLALRRSQWRHAGAVLATALGTGLALTACYWLRNWIWYGDPVYPILHKIFRERPWHADAGLLTDTYLNFVGTFPAPHTVDGVIETAKATVTFPATAWEFWEYHRNVPYFGALFTIASLAVPFLPVGKRAWVLLGGLYISLFFWYWQSHVDRYLQAYVPGMAALVAVVSYAAWQRWPSRLALIGTVTLQLAWGSSVFGLSAQVNKYKEALATLSSTYDGTQDSATSQLEPWVSLGKQLPPKAVVLVHDMYWHVGLQRRSVNDWVGLQGGLNYGRMSSAAQLVQTLRGMGVTHLAWGGSPMNDDSLAGDFRFLELAETLSIDRHYVGYLKVATVPQSVPPSGEEWVLVQGCQDSYAPGLYRFASTAVPVLRGKTGAPFPAPEQKLTPENATELVQRAKFALTRSGCNEVAEKAVRSSFKPLGSRAGATLWLRSDPH